MKHHKSRNWCYLTLRLWSMKLLVEMPNFQRVKLLEYNICWRCISKWKETKIGLQKYLRRKARHDRRSHMPNQHCLSLKMNAFGTGKSPRILPLGNTYFFTYCVPHKAWHSDILLLFDTISACNLHFTVLYGSYEFNLFFASCTFLSRYYVGDCLGCAEWC